MRLASFFALGAVATALSFAGCTTSTEPQSANLWKSPDAGSVFVFEGTSTRTTVSDTTTTTTSGGPATFILQRTGLSIGGKSNVAEIASESSSKSYLAYEPNGDFSIGDSGYNGWSWQTYPTGSHQTITLSSVDSVDPYGEWHISNGSRTYLGDESVTLGGHSYAASKVLEQTLHVDSSLDILHRYQSSVTIWWIPELKMFGKVITDDKTWDNYSPSSTPEYYHNITTMELVMYGQKPHQTSGGTKAD